MKRVALIVPFLVLILFSACGNKPGEFSSADWTAIVATQTATMWTPTVTPTANPDIPKILALLNDEFQNDDLEMTLDARYTASNGWFLYLPDNSRALYLEIHCACSFNSHCCIPERTFVITMHAMKNHAEEIIAQVPDFTLRVDVACHNGTASMGVLSAKWVDVKAYLQDEIGGSILGYRVTPMPTP